MHHEEVRLEVWEDREVECHCTRLALSSHGLEAELTKVEECKCKTSNDSPIVPAGLHEFLVSLADRMGDALPPVYVTENGCSGDDRVDDAGMVRDQHRGVYGYSA